ncbi:MAG: energy-coupling factor transporter ATPase, partial [Firmicutes bacterium]|nr:energy-coupling factor transporter ATPase [Bacillota bacterium]
ITHFMDEAARADRVVVMNRGKIMMDGTPREVFSHAEELSGLNLELPFAAELAAMLRRDGLDVPADIIDEEGLSDWLCASK